MAFCRLVFPLLVLSVFSCYASDVPTFMWGDVPDNTLKGYPLAPVSKDMFHMILKRELADTPAIVVFIEPTLSVEDFSLRNSLGETSFTNLRRNLKDAVYLPSVQNPVEVLDQFAKPLESDHMKLTENGLYEKIPVRSSNDRRVLFINLNDANDDESRYNFLHRHDEFMQKTVAELRKHYDQVVAVYTGQEPSWTISESHSRSKRAAAKDSHTLALDGLRLYAKSINVHDGNNTVPLSGVPTSTTEFNNTLMTVKMAYENTTLTLNFHQQGGYWFFDTITLALPSETEELFPAEEIFAIMGFSYRCLPHVTFSSANTTKAYNVDFEDLKVQPFFTTTNATQQFGDSFNCVGFFSAPIWAGLFVVFILLLITFYGIMMMMDIRTMDRFDDPKGKTITINAAE